jgi:hypothetical protein
MAPLEQAGPDELWGASQSEPLSTEVLCALIVRHARRRVLLRGRCHLRLKRDVEHRTFTQSGAKGPPAKPLPAGQKHGLGTGGRPAGG